MGKKAKKDFCFELQCPSVLRVNQNHPNVRNKRKLKIA
jgi:hypothetical protein